MNPGLLEPIFATLIVLVLLAVSGFYGWRQLQALRQLPHETELSAEDRRYEYGKVWRRLLTCLIMIVLAGLLISYYLFDINGQAIALGQQGRAANAAEQPDINIEKQRFLNIFSLFWMSAVLGVMAILVLAALDLWAIRRYGLRHYRQIQSDRRAMIEQQTAAIRSQRNGHN